jgi:hypothetical protein
MAKGKKGAHARKPSNLPLIAAAVVALIASAFFISSDDVASANNDVVADVDTSSETLQAFEHDSPSKFYFMYEVGPGERFNMRRDLIIR